jgi:hypothetical protein
MKFHVVVAASVLTLASLSSVAMAQSQPDRGQVVEICSDVARLERGRPSGEPHGACVGATGAYLQSIASVPPDERGQLVADLVVDLSNILFVPECEVGSEIADAISLAGQLAPDAQQAVQVNLIFDTVNACDFVVTAAIATSNSGSFVKNRPSNGLPASQN